MATSDMILEYTHIKANQTMESTISNNDITVLFALSVMSLLMGFFSNYLLTALTVVLFVIILFRRGIETGICSYVYLSIWGRFTTLPVFSGISLISIILSTYLFIYILLNRIKIKIPDFILLLIVFLEGCYSFFITKTTSGLFLAFDIMIIIYINSVLVVDKEKTNRFWKKLLLYLYVSTIFSVLWGIVSFFRGNSTRLYLYGQYIRRFQSTVGTDRSCMIYCAGLIYPLYYMRNKTLRIVSIFGLLTALLLSFSMTAIICGSVFFSIYLYDQYKNDHQTKRIWIIAGILAFALYFTYIWNFGSHIGPINTIVRRAQLIISRIDSGDVARATSGRTDILSGYQVIYQNLPFYKKLFGSGVTSFYGHSGIVNYSHNTYVDMIMYFGIIPAVFLLFRLIQSYAKRKKDDLAVQISLLKVAYVITGFSVSMLTNNYWWMFFLI